MTSQDGADGSQRPDAPDAPGGRSDERVLDARGERCPLPVIQLARLVRDEPELRRVTVLATDPAAAHDIPAWCRMRGQDLVEVRAEADHTAYVVEVVRPSTPATGR